MVVHFPLNAPVDRELIKLPGHFTAPQNYGI